MQAQRASASTRPSAPNVDVMVEWDMPGHAAAWPLSPRALVAKERDDRWRLSRGWSSDDLT